MKKININVKEDVYEKFKQLCIDRGSNVSAELRRFMLLETEKSK